MDEILPEIVPELSPNVSWKVKIWLLLRDRLRSGSCALLGASGTFPHP